MAQGTATEGQLETPAPSRRWFDAPVDFIARYREASIAAVAILLVIYIQLNNSVFLTSPLMSVVLRDTARIGMIAAGDRTPHPERAVEYDNLGKQVRNHLMGLAEAVDESREAIREQQTRRLQAAATVPDAGIETGRPGTQATLGTGR